MFECFIYMFKNNEFKKHFFKLFSLIFIFWIPLLIITLTVNNYKEAIPSQILIYLKLAFIIALLLPFLSVAGYFWCLTECIINRETDISANSVYNNKIKVKDVITFPEWSIKKFLWRGIASVVASVIMYIPFILLVGTSYINVADAAKYWGWSSSQTADFINYVAIFACLFIPGLLWNYAKRDSIVAVLNIPKVVYLMGTYTLRYIKHTFLFIVVYLLYAGIIKLFTNLAGLSRQVSTSVNGYIVYSISTDYTNIIIKIILILLGCYIIGLYFMYVFAQILGTLTPNNEK